ncbi:hypothetical protein F5Y17DRAFT_448442 [Xylariaceae sp. FL0594]|nr:hypothetical protein F5Y17DRAFT_448442 [Xylariaceae sp. FL0594]
MPKALVDKLANLDFLITDIIPEYDFEENYTVNNDNNASVNVDNSTNNNTDQDNDHDMDNNDDDDKNTNHSSSGISGNENNTNNNNNARENPHTSTGAFNWSLEDLSSDQLNVVIAMVEMREALREVIHLGGTYPRWRDVFDVLSFEGEEALAELEELPYTLPDDEQETLTFPSTLAKVLTVYSAHTSALHDAMQELQASSLPLLAYLPFKVVDDDAEEEENAATTSGSGSGSGSGSVNDEEEGNQAQAQSPSPSPPAVPLVPVAPSLAHREGVVFFCAGVCRGHT